MLTILLEPGPLSHEIPAELTLLPAGLRDMLAPQARHEVQLVERLMDVFHGAGYERVKPPLIEYERSLLSGFGDGLADQTFRLLDPQSQQPLALRPDITMQIARMALGRLVKHARPLRLCYRGEVLRVRGTDLRPERQFQQAGCELIGSLEATADAELICLALDGLRRLGVEKLSVDLTLPTLVPQLTADALVSDEDVSTLRLAIDRRDIAGAAKVPGPGVLVSRLLDASGPADRALEWLAGMDDLPEESAPDLQRLNEVVRAVSASQPDVSLTVDLVEQRGFEYQTGLSYTLFARGVRGELGRGGRYRLGAGIDAALPGGEPATGFTIYVDTLIRCLPPAAGQSRLYLPWEHRGSAGDARLDALRQDGWMIISALEDESDAESAARAQRCTHIWDGENAMAL